MISLYDRWNDVLIRVYDSARLTLGLRCTHFAYIHTETTTDMCEFVQTSTLSHKVEVKLYKLPDLTQWHCIDKYIGH